MKFVNELPQEGSDVISEIETNKNEITYAYIEDAINEINETLGVAESLGERDVLARGKHDLKKIAELVAEKLGLPVSIDIMKISTNDSNDKTNISHNKASEDNQFQSTQLVRTNRFGKGVESITAQVYIPPDLPFYGSPSLNGFPIKIKVSDNCISNPTTFAAMIAHELSHVLLRSLRHSQWENEFYTDLTAMMLGFQNVFRCGRKDVKAETDYGLASSTTITQTTTYGYLSDQQFDFAARKIDAILEEGREQKKALAKELKRCDCLLLKYERMFIKFKEFMKFLEKNTDIKISPDDGREITKFFQPGYIDDFLQYLKILKKQRKIVRDFLQNLFHYNKNSSAQVSYHVKFIQENSVQLKTSTAQLKENSRILGRYINHRRRIAIVALIFLNKIKSKLKGCKNI